MHGRWNDLIGDGEVIRIAADIGPQGYGSLGGHVSTNELAPVRDFAEVAVQEAGSGYVGFTRADAVTGTLLAQLPHSVEFRVPACCQASTRRR